MRLNVYRFVLILSFLLMLIFHFFQDVWYFGGFAVIGSFFCLAIMWILSFISDEDKCRKKVEKECAHFIKKHLFL